MAAELTNLVPSLGGLRFDAWDYAAMLLYFVCTVVYHGFYAYWTGRHPLETVKGKVALYRRTWVKRILDRDEQMLAVQSLRNLLMTSSFMASSALLVIAVILNYLLSQGGTGTPEMTFKLLVLVAVYGYAFFSFLLSTRYLNHFTILVGADRDLIGSVEPVDAITFLSNILNRAGNRFTMGQRAFYFSLPVVAWVVDPRAFIAFTVAIFVFLAAFLDFKKWRPPFPMRARAPEEAPPPAPTQAPAPPRAPSAPPALPPTDTRRGPV
ncbi:MAG TPA: DUF599 domain-containing protein [Candidatus Thermoplasmatota archaeon]|jgi:uncharacterized membrane protein|nr:DUF599 domain-containing protein [Candidatus Thermoplasmatota archaeon]